MESTKQRVVGAAPAGAEDRESVSRAVREMFTSIAPRYDLLNHVLSFNIDRLGGGARRVNSTPFLQRPDARVLDLCCGTGDMAFALRRRTRSATAQILGAIFLRQLQRAQRREEGKKWDDARPLQWVEADALRLPFPDAHFNLVTSAFGFRNLADYDADCVKSPACSLPAENAASSISATRGLLGPVLPRVLQESPSRNRNGNFGRQRPLQIFTASSSASVAGLNARARMHRRFRDVSGPLTPLAGGPIPCVKSG